MKHFMVRLKGSFYSFELYDNEGKQLYDLYSAIKSAKEQYPNEWTEVYNGETGALNEEIVCNCSHLCNRSCNGKTCGCKACKNEYDKFLEKK
jgi:hypothetical protein